MIRLGRLTLPCLVVLLAGCAFGPRSSYVTQLQQPGDAETLANSVADFVADRLPAASSTVALDPTPSDQSGNALTPALAGAIRRRGFAVAENGQSVKGNAHHLRYLITPLDNGDLVRLTLDDATEGARFFQRNTAGELHARGPFTVTQAGASR